MSAKQQAVKAVEEPQDDQRQYVERARSRARRESLIQAGLCVWCGEPRGVDGTGTLCRRHADEERVRTDKRLNYLREAGLCRSCGGPRGDDGTNYLCRTHADEASAHTRERRKQRIQAGLCEKCGQPRGEDGTETLCRRHADEQNARRDEQAKLRREAGLCIVCSEPVGGEGSTYYCISHAAKSAASTRARYERLREAGLCVSCGQPRGEDGTETLCRRHADAIAANDREQYERMIKAGVCPEHKGPMNVLEKCPACLYEASEITASNFSFVGLITPPGSGDKFKACLEACVGCKSCGRAYHSGHLYYLPHLPPDLKLRDEHVGAEGRGLWLRFSGEDEQGRVEIEYEACSLPNDKCTRLATKKVALDFLRRYRAGEPVSGACQKHVHDRGRLGAAVAARIRQQLDQAQTQNGDGQKNDAEKRKQEREDKKLLNAVNVVARLWEEAQHTTRTYQRKLDLITKVEFARGLGSKAQGEKGLENVAHTYLTQLHVNEMFPGAPSWYRCFVEAVVEQIEKKMTSEAIVTNLKSRLARSAA